MEFRDVLELWGVGMLIVLGLLFPITIIFSFSLIFLIMYITHVIDNRRIDKLNKNRTNEEKKNGIKYISG